MIQPSPRCRSRVGCAGSTTGSTRGAGLTVLAGGRNHHRVHLALISTVILARNRPNVGVPERDLRGPRLLEDPRRPVFDELAIGRATANNKVVHWAYRSRTTVATVAAVGAIMLIAAGAPCPNRYLHGGPDGCRLGDLWQRPCGIVEVDLSRPLRRAPTPALRKQGDRQRRSRPPASSGGEGLGACVSGGHEPNGQVG